MITNSSVCPRLANSGKDLYYTSTERQTAKRFNHPLNSVTISPQALWWWKISLHCVSFLTPWYFPFLLLQLPMLRTLGGIAAIVLAIYTAALITIKANIPSARDYVIIKTFISPALLSVPAMFEQQQICYMTSELFFLRLVLHDKPSVISILLVFSAQLKPTTLSFCKAKQKVISRGLYFCPAVDWTHTHKQQK